MPVETAEVPVAAKPEAAKPAYEDPVDENLIDTDLLPNEPAKAKVEKPAEPKVEEKPKHSPRSVATAQRLGIPDYYINSATPEALSEAIEVTALRWHEEANKKPEAAKPAEVKDDEYELPPGAEDWDEGIKSAVLGLGKKLNAVEKENKALKGEREKEKQETQQQRMFNDADKAFTSKGREKLFGKGTVEEGVEPKFLARRQQVLTAAIAAQQLNPKAPFSACVEKVINDLYDPPEPDEEKPKTPADAYAATAKQQWKEGTVARPTKVAPTEEPKGEKRARKGVAAWLNANFNPDTISDVHGDEEDSL